ncbi:hypothetical protein DPEC_G00261790 [Dallia pectoralis]|uniref:Uncharacterized protein n=1 Tax=Dallia pectoralis TaxID=75939 RepID=A0ACC2FRY1_DALPE|nr:hypothetical protein DPEC_G00261790 [Dallia pectoralis]
MRGGVFVSHAKSIPLMRVRGWCGDIVARVSSVTKQQRSAGTSGWYISLVKPRSPGPPALYVSQTIGQTSQHCSWALPGTPYNRTLSCLSRLLYLGKVLCDSTVTHGRPKAQ